MNLRISVGLVLFFIAFQAQADIYKCLNRYEKVVYSEEPCEGRVSEKVSLPEINSPGNLGASIPLPKHQPVERPEPRPSRADTRNHELVDGLSCPDRETIRRAISEHRVLRCMTKDDVRRAAGRFDHYRVSTAFLDGDVQETWFFALRFWRFPQEVTFVQDLVVGFSDIPKEDN